MEGMEKIIHRINNDSAEKASLIGQAAKSQAEQHLLNEKAMATDEANILVKNAKIRAEEIINRGKSMADLEARKMILATKQELIAQVYDMVLAKLRSLPEDQYFELIKKIILKTAKGDEQLLLSDNDRARLPGDFLSGVNNALKESGRAGEINLSEEKRAIDGGAILVSGQTELNYSFESIIRMTRDDYEADIVKILFGDSAEAGVS